MDKKKKNVKLFTTQHTILVSCAIALGLGWHVFKYYRVKGVIDSGLLISLVFSLVIIIPLIGFIIWWANKPEKEDDHV